MDDQEKLHERPGEFALDEPMPLGATEPVDVMQVRIDDALITALGSRDELQIDDPIDERLAGLLRSWRQDVHTEPERPLDLAAATTVLGASSRPARHRHRQNPSAQHRQNNPFGPLATAAAILVIAFIGLGLAARGAEPGDPLWGVSKVLYSDRAKSVEAKVTVTKKLDQARQALQSGNPVAAMIALEEAKQKLPVVAVEDGKQELASATDQLIAEARGTSTASAPLATSMSQPAPTSTMPTATSTVVEQPPAPAVTTTNPVVPRTTVEQATTTTSAPPPVPTTSEPLQLPGAGGGPGAGGPTTPQGAPQADPPKDDTLPSGGTNPTGGPTTGETSSQPSPTS